MVPACALGMREGENLTMASEKDNATSQQTQCRFNKEQYDILRRCSEGENIAEWNSYRAEQPETTIQLQNADLRRGRLEGAQLSGASLEGARFEGADLLATDLRNADLRKANFENANLWGATLSEAILLILGHTARGKPRCSLDRAQRISQNQPSADPTRPREGSFFLVKLSCRT